MSVFGIAIQIYYEPKEHYMDEVNYVIVNVSLVHPFNTCVFDNYDMFEWKISTELS